LVIAPSIAMVSSTALAEKDGMHMMHKMHKGDANQVEVKMTKLEDGTFKAVVTSTTTVNGEANTTAQVFTGTKAEVKAQVHKLKGMNVLAKSCAGCKGKKELCANCKKKAACKKQSAKTVMTKSCCKGKTAASCANKKA